MRSAPIALFFALLGCAEGGLPPPGGLFEDERATQAVAPLPRASEPPETVPSDAPTASVAQRAELSACAAALVGQPMPTLGALLGRCLGRATVPRVGARGTAGDVARFRDGTMGIVLATAGGRVKFAYVRRGVVAEGVVTPRTPHTRRAPDGRIANTFLRPIRPGEPRRAPRLAGELLEGFSAPPAPIALARGDPFAE